MLLRGLGTLTIPGTSKHPPAVTILQQPSSSNHPPATIIQQPSSSNHPPAVTILQQPFLQQPFLQQPFLQQPASSFVMPQFISQSRTPMKLQRVRKSVSRLKHDQWQLDARDIGHCWDMDPCARRPSLSQATALAHASHFWRTQATSGAGYCSGARKPALAYAGHFNK
jgi:hypothetical protein